MGLDGCSRAGFMLVLNTAISSKGVARAQNAAIVLAACRKTGFLNAPTSAPAQRGIFSVARGNMVGDICDVLLTGGCRVRRLPRRCMLDVE